MANEIPSKFALLKYVLGCASDVVCVMKVVTTIRDAQKNDTFVVAHASKLFLLTPKVRPRGICFLLSNMGWGGVGWGGMLTFMLRCSWGLGWGGMLKNMLR